MTFVLKTIYLSFSFTSATVANSRACTTCRECIRHEKFGSKINLGKRKDVFEFHIETLGVYTPQDLALQSMQILKEKAHKWMSIL